MMKVRKKLEKWLICVYELFDNNFSFIIFFRQNPTEIRRLLSPQTSQETGRNISGSISCNSSLRSSLASTLVTSNRSSLASVSKYGAELDLPWSWLVDSVYVAENVRNLFNADIHRWMFENPFSLLGFNYLSESAFLVLWVLWW